MRLVLAEILFGQPALLGGIALAALPVVIHLLLRPRPHRTRFPAIVLLRRVVLTGQRSSRLRNLLLMLIRASLLVLLALLLAGPVRTDGAADFVGADPLACAIVLDDSASMRYREDATTTRLDASRAAAADLVHQSAAWSEGSALVTLTSAMPDAAPPELGADRAAMLERLDLVGNCDSAQPLGAAISAAGELLRTARQPVRRLVIFSDGAASAWRDVNPTALAGIENLAVRVVTSGGEPQSNLALAAVAGPQRMQPATASISMQAAIAAEGVNADCWLTVFADGQRLQRIGPVQAESGALRRVEFALPPLVPGPHLLTFELEPADRLDFDQRRFLALQTAEPPIAWLVAAADDDLSTVILRNLLAPEVLKPEQQRVRLRSLSAEQLEAGGGEAVAVAVDGASQTTGDSQATGAQSPLLTVVLSNAALSREAQALLLRQLERGATIVLAPASGGGDQDWAGLRQLLAEDPPADEELTDATSFTWEAASEFANYPELMELSRCGVRRRLRVEGLRTDSEVHARYADDRPAVVSRRRGLGRIILLTTSPDPEWSDLGIRAAGLISWLHLLVDQALGPPDAVANLGLREESRRPFTPLPASGLVRVVSNADEAKPTWMRLKEHTPEQSWPTDHVAAYTLVPAGAGQLAAAYTVNWPAEESALSLITAPQLRRALGVTDVRLESADDRNTEQPGLLARLFSIRDLRKVLAVLLVAVFVSELVISARRAGRPGGVGAEQRAA